MPQDQSKRREFYDFLSTNGVKMPDIETFDRVLDDPSTRREFYSFLSSNGVKMPEYEVYDYLMVPQGKAASPTVATSGAPVIPEPDLEARRSMLPEDLRKQLTPAKPLAELEREYAEAGTTAQPGLETATPMEAALAGGSVITGPVEDVAIPIFAGVSKMIEGAPNAISGLARLTVSGGKDNTAVAQTLRGIGQTGLGALETVINSIPAMMAVNAVTGAVGEPFTDTVSKTVIGYAEALREKFTPELDEKILRHVASKYGAKSAEQIMNVSIGAFFGLPMLAGMVVGEGAGSTTDSILKDKDLTQDDKQLIVDLVHNIAFLMTVGGVHKAQKEVRSIGKLEAEAGVEGFTDVMREFSAQPTKEIKGGPGRRVSPFGFERPAEPVQPVAPKTAVSSPRGQFVLNQLEKDINSAIETGSKFDIGRILSKEVSDLVKPSSSLTERFEGLVAKAQEHNKKFGEENVSRETPEVPTGTVTPLAKPIPGIEGVQQPASAEILKRIDPAKATVEDLVADIRDYNTMADGISLGKIQRRYKVSLERAREVIEAHKKEPEKVEIPEFKSSQEAIDWGRANAKKARQIEPLLRQRRLESEAEFRKLFDEGKNQEAIEAHFRGQLATESLEFLKEPGKETPSERVQLDEFAERVARGEKMESPEDVQFYQTNAKKIEERLQKLLPKEEVVETAKPPDAKETTKEATITVDRKALIDATDWKAAGIEKPERLSDAELRRAAEKFPKEKAKPAEATKAEAIVPKTGVPYEFNFIHNTNKSPNMGERFGQHLEPVGRYIQQTSDTPEQLRPELKQGGFIAGTAKFENPLVVDFGGGYGEKTNWKSALSERYAGKTGKELSQAIRDDGYDGIITFEKGHTSEIVDIRAIKPTVQKLPKAEAKPPEPKDAVQQAEGFISAPVASLKLNLKEFQGREDEFSKQTYDRIVADVESGSFLKSALPPIQVWERDNSILSGHTRAKVFEDIARGEVIDAETGKPRPVRLPEKYKKSDFENINAQVVQAETLEQARKIAQESNQGAAQTLVANAAYVRNDLLPKLSGKELKDKLDVLYGENKIIVLALAHLNPNGKALEAVEALQKSDAQSRNRAIEMAVWVGKARQKFPELTNSHENEMFDFVKANYGISGARTGTEFVERVRATVEKLGEFDKSKPLNLERHATRTVTEQEYWDRLTEAKKVFDDARQERLKKQEEFLARGAERERLDELMKPYEERQAVAQAEYRDLLENKAERLKTIRQSEMDLFGPLEDLTNAELKNAERAGERRSDKEIEDAESVVKTLGSEVKTTETLAEEAKQRERAAAAKDVVDAEIGKLTKAEQPTEAKRPPAKPPEVGAELPDVMEGRGRSASMIPTQLEQTTKAIVSPADIVAYLSKGLGVPIRVGKKRFGQFVFGIYRRKPEEVRLKEAERLDFTSHEVAHHLDKTSFGSDPARFDKWKDELKDLDYDQKKRRPNEGFAEFMRHFLTLEDAHTVAPKFYDYFVNDFLVKNPEVGSLLWKAKGDIALWKGPMGAMGRIQAQIDYKGKKRDTGEATMPLLVKVQEAITHTSAPMRHVVTDILNDANKRLSEQRVNEEKRLRDLGLTGKALEEALEKYDPLKLRPSEHPAEVMTAIEKTAGARAYEAVVHGGFDFGLQKVVKSLSDIVDQVNRLPGQVEEALAYAFSRHALTLHDKNINPGISREDAQFVVDRYGSDRNKTFSKEVTEWSNYLLDYLVEAGGFSPQAAVTMREMYPFYIPLKRAYGSDLGSAVRSGRGKGYVDLPSPIRRIYGSGRQIINPLESLIQNTEAIISTADKARVARVLIDLLDKPGVEGFGKWIVRVDPPLEKHFVTLEKLQKQIEARGGDLSKADMEGVLTFFSNGYSYKGKDNIVSIYRNGKREFYQLQPDLFRSLKNMDRITMPWFIEYIMAPPARMVRLGATGLRPGFSFITNPIRDAQIAFLQSEGGGGRPDRLAIGYLEELGLKKTSEYKRQFRRAGGEMSGPLGMDRNMIQATVQDLLANDKKRVAMNIAQHPIEAMRRVLSVTESGPRLAEFTAVMEKYKPKIEEANARGDVLEAKKLREDAAVEAANRAAEVTVNFRRAGYVSQWLNQIIPFFNPVVQGMSVFSRTLYNHPARSLARVAPMTALTLGLWWFNKDEEWYQNLPDWERYAFWHFKAGDEIIRLPKPFEWGFVFSGIPEAIAHSTYMKDPTYIKQAVGEMVESANPFSVPALFKPALEVYHNWDYFRERPIVTRGKESLPPAEQYTTYTSTVAKMLGDALGASPSKIDHLLNGYTGGLAGDILNTLPKQIREKADLPVVGRAFMRRTTLGFGGESVQRFYDTANATETVVRTISVAKKTGKWEMMRHFDKEDYARYLLRSDLNRTSEHLRELREKARRVEALDIDGGLKIKVLQGIGYAASSLTKQVLEKVREKEKMSAAELLSEIQEEGIE